MKFAEKTLAVVLTAFIVLTMLPQTVLAADGTVSANGTYNLSDYGNGSTVTVGAGLTVTLTDSASTTYTNLKIVCGAGVSLTVNNVNIDNSATDDACPLSFTGTGNTLTLAGTNTLKGGPRETALKVNETTQLTITGSGSLTSTGGELSAGIGGNSNVSAGIITINGGTVTATGGSSAPGIGGGHNRGGGTLVINGGVVTANGGQYGAGIGGGYTGGGGATTVNGGTVTANGGQYGAGIGGGRTAKYSDNNGGTVTVSGGTVRANGGEHAAGIGGGGGTSSGTNGSGGTVTVSGGTVTATGGFNAAGIGGGRYGNGAAVTVSGGTVKATGSSFTSDIGGGYYASGSGTLKNAAGADVYLTTIRLVGSGAANAAVSSLTTDLTYTYGVNGVLSDGDGKLYLYLPQGTTTTVVGISDGMTFSGSATTAASPTAFDFSLDIMPAERIDLDFAALVWDTIKNGNSAQSEVKTALNLPAAGANATAIAWSASPVGVINTDTGEVKRPFDGDIAVALTATVSHTGAVSKTKTFNLTVSAYSVVFEAEDAAVASGKVYSGTQATGASGGKLVGNLGVAGSSGVQWNNLPALSMVEIRYASINSGTISIYKNGAHLQDVPFASTGGWYGEGCFGSLFIPLNIADGDSLKIQYDSGDAILNLDYIECHGLVAENAALNPAGGTFDKKYPADVSTTVEWNDLIFLTDVKAGGTSIGTANYSVIGNTLTVKKEYLTTRPLGETILSVEFQGGAPVTLTINIMDSGIIHANGTYNLSNYENGSVVIVNTGLTVTLTGNADTTYTNVRFVCEAGVSLTLDNVRIDHSATDNACALSFTGAGNTLTLVGTNTLRSGKKQPGIKAQSGTQLTIQGSGSLASTGGQDGAGIGGGDEGSGGTVTITGGTVTASGGKYGAGIGGGGGSDYHNDGNGGTVTISGGTVTANGGDWAAGIGSGDNGNTAGSVTITGGTVMANGGVSGAGIGGGDRCGGGTVTITGGIVTATGGGSAGAGIGGGSYGNGGTVIISGGTIKASGYYAADIGGGDQSSGDGTLKNADGTDVYLTTIRLVGSGAANAAVSSLTSDLSYTYGLNGVSSDSEGRLYLYLPQGTITTQVGISDGNTFSGNAATAASPMAFDFSLDPTPAERIEAALAALVFDVIKNGNSAQNEVKTALYLPKTGASGTNITWSASPAGFINTDTGAITNPLDRDTAVALTATVSYTGAAPKTKTFSLTVCVMPLMFEAEDAAIVSGKVYSGTQAAGASGGKHVGNLSVAGSSSVQWNSLPASSMVEIRYASINSGTVSIYKNGAHVMDAAFTATGGWYGEGCFASLFIPLTIADGDSIKIQYDAGDAILNLDYIECYAVCLEHASLSPASGEFNKVSKADFSATVEWNDARSITGIKAGATFIGTENYSVNGNTLNIKKEYLATQPLGALVLSVEFQRGAPATLTINIIDTGNITANGTYNLSDYGNDSLLTINAGLTVTLTGSAATTYANLRIVCAAGVNLTLNNVNIDNSATEYSCPLSFTGAGNTLTLAGTNTLKGGYRETALKVEDTTQLTMNGSGSLTATGGEFSAGIGGAINRPGGIITIDSGTVTAVGGNSASGIGGGHNYSGGTTTINGGTVTATGGNYGAGIGGGNTGSGGTVVINGGTVKATGNNAEGIGGGNNSSGNGTLKNAAGANVYLTTIRLVGSGAANAAVSSLTSDLTYTYGVNGVLSDSDGKLYLYLPQGTITTVAGISDGITFSGNATTAASPTAFDFSRDPTPAELIDADLAALVFDVIKNGNSAENEVKTALNLPTAGANGTTIAWSASPAGFINTDTGGVKRPFDADKAVTLTATVSYAGGTSKTKTFNLTVSVYSAVFEAEDAAIVGGTVFSGAEAAGASGGKQVGNLSVAGRSVGWNNLPASSMVEIRYASINSGTISIYKNGAHVMDAAFTSTGGWYGEGRFVSLWLPLEINNGDSLKIQYDAGDAILNLDYIACHGVYLENAALSPASRTFDKKYPDDVRTAILWNDLTAIPDVKAGGTSIGTANYSVIGNTLTVKKEYLATLPFGETVFTVEFQGGASATLTVNIVESGKITVNGTYNLSDYGNGSTIVILTGLTVTLTGSAATTYTNVKINCEAGVSLTLDNVNIDNSAVSDACPLSFTGVGNTLTLAGTNTLRSGKNQPGIKAQSGAQLTMNGSGSLTATGGEYGAGISNSGAGIITIDSGNIAAIGTWNGAGIGGTGSSGGTVTINGGNVTATGGDYGAGIGGTVIICGGNVTANGGLCGAGIGKNGTVTISGGIVTANGGKYGAGIGKSDAVTISGGIVTATGGQYGAGIGGGDYDSGGTVVISGGTVTANGGWCGAGIGGGGNSVGGTGGSGGTVIISGGTVKANGNNAADIGGGANSSNHGTLKNGDGVDVYLTVIQLWGSDTANAAVSSLTTDLTYTYGVNDVFSDSLGKLYLYLPLGTKTTAVSASAKTFTGNAVTENSPTVFDFAVNASVSPATGTFDKTYPADVTATVTWNSASAVTDIKVGSVSIGAGNYSVVGNTLTIKKEYLAAQSIGGLVLTVEFDKGLPTLLTITVTDILRLNGESEYQLDTHKRIIGIGTGQSGLFVKSNFVQSDILIYKDGVLLPDTAYVGTGCVIILTDKDGNPIDEITAVVAGDLNGDSAVDALDMFLADKVLNGHATLAGAYFEAANLDAANIFIDVFDYSALINLAVGKSGDASFPLKDGSSLQIDTERKFLTGIGQNQSARSVIGQFVCENTAVYRDGVLLSDTDPVGTGCTVCLMSGGRVIGELTVVVSGDLSGDGVVDALDLFLAESAVNGHIELEGAYFAAADVDGANGLLDAADLLALTNLLVGGSP